MHTLDVIPYFSFILVLFLTDSALPFIYSLFGLDLDNEPQGCLVLLVHHHLVDTRVVEQGLLTVFSLDMCLDVFSHPRLVATGELTD